MNGVINFLKPPGMSSNGAVVFLRRLLGEKTGHAGTLDPGACGVLPICVGKATKISSHLMGGKKEYIAEITFGKSTDTGDSYGRVTGMSDAPFPAAADIRHVLKSFIGNITQQTPAYSAVKHGGRKLYQLARAGEDIPCKTRDVVIHDITYIAKTRDDAHLLRVVCGKGTYIRTLCEDVAKSLNTLAYMSFLARTRCAGLDIRDAYTADALINLDSDIKNTLLPMDGFLEYMPKISASSDQRAVLINGGCVACDKNDIENARIYIDNAFIGIGCLKSNKLKITTLLVG
ncbi:MAG: tRNA pseudouridine(55) synthase TruB [Eubacteriales bacterium]|nr:tRNA pseudouridine(55) synthase TruB [Eubacteriales bacterium]